MIKECGRQNSQEFRVGSPSIIPMGIDVVILSRGREKELSLTLDRLSRTNLHVIVMHNGSNSLATDRFGTNINYVFCPGLNFGKRAAIATEYLRNDYCLISADDDGLVESELQNMEKFLERNPGVSSVGGVAIGAFPYGNSVAGTIAYREMNGYQSRATNTIERITNHLVLDNMKFPRTALYRLCRRELTCKILEALGASSKVGTPYIYEVTAEIVSAWYGNAVYISCPYWIRNWKNEMISKGDWNRQYGFDNWWNDSNRQTEKEEYLNFLSTFLSIDKSFVRALLTDCASAWGKVFKTPSKRELDRKWKFGRHAIQNLILKFMPGRAPTSIEKLITDEFPNLSNRSRAEIREVTHHMFLSRETH